MRKKSVSSRRSECGKVRVPEDFPWVIAGCLLDDLADL